MRDKINFQIKLHFRSRIRLHTHKLAAMGKNDDLLYEHRQTIEKLSVIIHQQKKKKVILTIK
jgi:hypothetical protein